MSTLYLGVALRLAELGVSGSLIGLTYCLYQVMSIVGGIVIPRYLSKHYGSLLVVSCALISCLMAVIALSNSDLIIASSYAVLGMLLSVIPPAMTYLLTRSQVSIKSSLLVLTLPQNVGICVGFLACGVAGLLLPLSRIMLYMSTLGIVALSGSILLHADLQPKALGKTTEARTLVSGHSSSRDIANPGLGEDVNRVVMLFYTAVFTSFLAAGVFFPVLPIVLSRLGLTVSEIYLVRFGGALAATFSYLYIINLMCASLDRVFRFVSYSLAARSLLFLLLLPLMLLRPQRLALLASVCALMCFIGMSWSIIYTGLRATALAFGIHAHRIVGYTNSISSLGLVLGSLMSGMLMDLNVLLIPVISGLIAMVAAMLYTGCARTCSRCQPWVLSSALSPVPMSSPSYSDRDRT